MSDRIGFVRSRMKSMIVDVLSAEALKSRKSMKEHIDSLKVSN